MVKLDEIAIYKLLEKIKGVLIIEQINIKEIINC
jgi:hypothetical protein